MVGTGGHVDEGEMPHQALTRELKEEVNLSGQFLIYPKLRVLLDHEKEWMIPSPYITMLQLIPAYKDKPEHYHYDYGYLMVTKERSLSKNIRELKDAGWFDFTQIKSLDTFNIIQAVCSEIMKR
jgi:ADP-ribose pyrophosphatase YjhB (NUDIX family)